jgi:hypothetical protein
VIPEIDIWRAARLMLERYGDKALDKERRCLPRTKLAASAMIIIGM